MSINRTFTYKCYKGRATQSEDGVFEGRVTSIDDVVTFEGTTVENAESEFQQSVDDYLEFCEAEKLRANPPNATTLAAIDEPSEELASFKTVEGLFTDCGDGAHVK